MRVLIAGAGHAGLSVAIHLRRLGHDVTVVDRDEAIARRAFEQFGLVTLAGDATSARLLRDAEVARADVVVAMLRRDADNLAVALLARAAGARRVMVRMRDSEYRGVYLAAGVDRILPETEVIIGALATAIEYDAVRHSMVLGSGETVAFELAIPRDAAVVGRAVKDIAVDPGFPATCVFAGLFDEEGRFEAPRGQSVVAPGMAVLLVAARSDLSRTIEFFMRRAEPG